MRPALTFAVQLLDEVCDGIEEPFRRPTAVPANVLAGQSRAVAKRAS